MIEIITKRRSGIINCKVIEGSTTIEMDLMDDVDRDDFAHILLETILSIGPSFDSDYVAWIKKLLDEHDTAIIDELTKLGQDLRDTEDLLR